MTTAIVWLDVKEQFLCIEFFKQTEYSLIILKFDAVAFQIKILWLEFSIHHRDFYFHILNLVIDVYIDIFL